MQAIAIHFDLPWPMPPEVKEADIRMLATEAPVLMLHAFQWKSIEGIRPFPVPIEPWTPERTYREFMTEFSDLMALIKAA